MSPKVKYAVFNPDNINPSELPVIYGYNSGVSSIPGLLAGLLIAQNGEPLGSHVCSDESYMLSDLGILDGTRPDRHHTFRQHYPHGYRMDFVSHEDIPSHKGLQAAMKLCSEIEDNTFDDEDH